MHADCAASSVAEAFAAPAHLVNCAHQRINLWACLANAECLCRVSCRKTAYLVALTTRSPCSSTSWMSHPARSLMTTLHLPTSLPRTTHMTMMPGLSGLPQHPGTPSMGSAGVLLPLIASFACLSRDPFTSLNPTSIICIQPNTFDDRSTCLGQQFFPHRANTSFC